MHDDPGGLYKDRARGDEGKGKERHVNKLRAVIIIIAGSGLATGMAVLPVQAASIHAVSPVARSGKCGPFRCPADGSSTRTATATEYFWRAYAGAQDFMNSDDADGDLVYVSTGADVWKATGCDTLPNLLTGTNTIFCHQQDQYNTALCLSSYGVALGGQLKLDDCDATGGGRQDDEQWWFAGNLTGTVAGVLLNYGKSEIAVSNGNDNDPVNLGEPSGANNNYWGYDPS